uniref:Uncharacterized protein n=1 Tax=Picea sitchensis TaxID=3332 RepID=A0A6B9XS44_PICSI|nr:hypothetical protein Q903MT_gene3805 [Picea sitchensis]
MASINICQPKCVSRLAKNDHPTFTPAVGTRPLYPHPLFLSTIDVRQFFGARCRGIYSLR